ncbi:HlyD family secretion protein [Leptolyngbya sp. 'hensonii']|uniref:ABC exporter membrane fusion protein n=1 Tax=Leptolyngbya sp. 'hensonii' TaxID=1922337 RepID=UPI0009500D81|nr:ABC exporter membrane fusion protein [Leptolyngbya sp. 'hensonii']OLP19236.1 HlyD family secretion protein [Leptolyngbya sp. 'hensonii']
MTHDVTDKVLSPFNFALRPSITVATLAAILVGGGSLYTIWQLRSAQGTTRNPVQVTAPARTVTALGRLEPQGEVIKLSAPTSSEGNRVEQLLVREGDTVKAEQVIAVLDSRDRLQASLEQAEEQVRIAEANLARVRAGAKRGEIQAQQATIARIAVERKGDINAQIATVNRLQAELRNAEVENTRYLDLYREGAISASQRDSKQLALQTTQERLQEAQATLERTRLAQIEQLSEAQATLDRIAEVRPVDVSTSEAELGYAQASLRRAEANLKQAYVRSPQAGQVLKIHTRSGELVSPDGIVEIGQTHRMVAVAEVYESDVAQVRRGQRVRVTSDATTGELHGTVERIGLRVLRQNVINTDPSANVDARVVEVRVTLDEASSRKVAGLTNLQVKVVIEQ